jgi:cytosine/adenosine deaminase-related metal-dependent hydrolase
MNVPPRRYTASWVLPCEGPPIEHGAVLVDRTGRIAAVGPDAVVPAPPGTGLVELPGVALLPGLINAHTHLELTGLEGAAPQTGFADWIRRIIALKAARSPAEALAAAEQGIRECWAAGITTVADTGDSGAVIQALAGLGASGIAYHEVFGPDPAQADVQFAAWVSRVDELAAFAGPRVLLGASPHAPYSVSGPLYRRVAEFARSRGLPLAVHLAEGVDESLLLERGEGAFARAWAKRGIPLLPLPGRTPVEWLDQHDVLGETTLCIHVVRATAGDLDRLARLGSAVAHCPRSNRRHGHGIAPLRGMLDRGLRVGVGTDSVASVSPLDLLAEAREARAIGGLSAEDTLQLVTAGAALALGLQAQVGTLTVGKWGDLVALELPGPVDAGQLADTLLSLGRGAVRLTVVGGREVFRG